MILMCVIVFLFVFDTRMLSILRSQFIYATVVRVFGSLAARQNSGVTGIARVSGVTLASAATLVLQHHAATVETHKISFQGAFFLSTHVKTK